MKKKKKTLSGVRTNLLWRGWNNLLSCTYTTNMSVYKGHLIIGGNIPLSSLMPLREYPSSGETPVWFTFGDCPLLLGPFGDCPVASGLIVVPNEFVKLSWPHWYCIIPLRPLVMPSVIRWLANRSGMLVLIFTHVVAIVDMHHSADRLSSSWRFSLLKSL